MRGIRLLWVALLGFGLLSACGPLRLSAPGAKPLPSPSSTWTLQLSQSGGIAGVQLALEITSAGQLTATDNRSGRTATETLPPSSLSKLRSLIDATTISQASVGHSSCADCFVYLLTFRSDAGTQTMQVDDVSLAASGAQELITFLRSLRDSALASKP